MSVTYMQASLKLDAVRRKWPLLKNASRLDLIYLTYGLIIVGAVVLSYFLGAFSLLPYDPEEMDLDNMMAGPLSAGHLLGTDFLGRDLLSRLILGIQAYFLPGLVAVSIALIGGSLAGVLAGFAGRRWDMAVTYSSNLIDSVPRLVLILLVVAAFKPDIYYIMIVVGLTNIPNIAALVKNKILALKRKNFIESAIAIGLPTRVIVFRHILWYNCRSLLIIQATLGMGEAILMETSLSYLGFGVQEPTPSWGNMVQAGSNYLLQGDFWPSTAPALAILFTILGFYLLGDALNRILEGRKAS